MDGYVAALRKGGPPDVAAALTSATERGRRVLRVYAERAATRAVRDDMADLLVKAAIATVVGGLDDFVPEALMVMPLIEDAARRLGVHLPDVFQEAAGAVGHPGAVNLMRWLTRAPENRTLECMGYAAVEDEEGFRYQWIA